jgi:ribosome biogenesis SPOUT family RNA methylase Rps3
MALSGIGLAADNKLGEAPFRDRTSEFKTSMSRDCRRLAELETFKIDTSVLLVSLIMRRFQPGSPPGFFLS